MMAMTTSNSIKVKAVGVAGSLREFLCTPNYTLRSRERKVRNIHGSLRWAVNSE
jgi:hypothetical protein